MNARWVGRLAAPIALGLAVASLAGCGSASSGGSTPSGSSSESSAPPSSAGSLKIVIAAPLTGDYAETGQDMVNGAQLAADWLNAKGGVQSGPLKGSTFEITGADDQLDTKAATTIAADFAQDDSAFAMGGFVTSGQAQAAGVVLERSGLGTLVSFAAADFLTDEADNLMVIVPSAQGTAKVGACLRCLPRSQDRGLDRRRLLLHG